MDKPVIKVICRHFFILFCLALAIFIRKLFGIDCPVWQLTGIHCPCCGLSRAAICLFQLDFSESLRYHPMLIPSFAGLLLFAHKNHFGRFKNNAYILFVLSVIGLAVCYCIRLYFDLIP